MLLSTHRQYTTEPQKEYIEKKLEEQYGARLSRARNNYFKEEDHVTVIDPMTEREEKNIHFDTLGHILKAATRIGAALRRPEAFSEGQKKRRR